MEKITVGYCKLISRRNLDGSIIEEVDYDEGIVDVYT